ncbi:MAG: diguanylate cyclase (GGDEF)-like protein [Planctomycetota bacterium]
MNIFNNAENPRPVSSFHLQQQELVNFLYSRVSGGMLITLFISAVASLMVYFELVIQGRELWVIGWFVLLLIILLLRCELLRNFRNIDNKSYFPYQVWHNRFFIGVLASSLMQGGGAALVMPYITTNVQIILHSLLLGMGAGAVAYLSTSLRIYVAYLVAIMLPVTLWLLTQKSLDTAVLAFLYVFLMVALSISVKRMNVLVNEALYYRFDNETLIEDLQRLLESVSKSNKALEKITTTDELTGLSSYRAFRVQLEDIWRRHLGKKMHMSVIKLNIDYYYEFNTYYGQEAGDRYLREIARMLGAEISHKSQMIARLNGAEFAILLPGMNCDDAKEMAIRMMAELAKMKIEHLKSRVASQLTMSVGLGYQMVRKNTTSRDILTRVDTALKLAKEKGRNRLETLEG